MCHHQPCVTLGGSLGKLDPMVQLSCVQPVLQHQCINPAPFLKQDLISDLPPTTKRHQSPSSDLDPLMFGCQFREGGHEGVPRGGPLPSFTEECAIRSWHNQHNRLF